MPPPWDGSVDTSNNGDTKMQVEEIVIRRPSGGTSNSSTDGPPSLLLGDRLRTGSSLLQISHLLTGSEIDYLKEAALDTAQQSLGRLESESSGDGQGDRGQCCVRMPIWTAAQRDNSLDGVHLSPAVSTALEQILERVFTLMDTDLICSSVKDTLFAVKAGDSKSIGRETECPTTTTTTTTTSSTKTINTDSDDQSTNAPTTDTSTNADHVSLKQLFRTDQLEFAIREPAMNVYHAPFGHFGLHKDGRALTILVALSDPQSDFEGGGTAFWKERFPKPGWHEPSLILRPAPGTAILFGGSLSHSGLHIRSGQRVVFVSSFSRRDDTAA